MESEWQLLEQELARMCNAWHQDLAEFPHIHPCDLFPDKAWTTADVLHLLMLVERSLALPNGTPALLVDHATEILEGRWPESMRDIAHLLSIYDDDPPSIYLLGDLKTSFFESDRRLDVLNQSLASNGLRWRASSDLTDASAWDAERPFRQNLWLHLPPQQDH